MDRTSGFPSMNITCGYLLLWVVFSVTQSPLYVSIPVGVVTYLLSAFMRVHLGLSYFTDVVMTLVTMGLSTAVFYVVRLTTMTRLLACETSGTTLS